MCIRKIKLVRTHKIRPESSKVAMIACGQGEWSVCCIQIATDEHTTNPTRLCQLKGPRQANTDDTYTLHEFGIRKHDPYVTHRHRDFEHRCYRGGIWFVVGRRSSRVVDSF